MECKLRPSVPVDVCALPDRSRAFENLASVRQRRRERTLSVMRVGAAYPPDPDRFKNQCNAEFTDTDRRFAARWRADFYLPLELG